MSKTSTTILVSALLAQALAFMTAAQAQELNLFESVDVVPAGQAINGPVNEQGALPNTPVFTLLGTSRMGGKYKATLQAGNGEVIRVDFQGADSVPIPGYIGYRLVEVDSRQVAISFPAGTPCVGAEDKGVQCGTDGLARLSLRTAAPVVIASAPAQEAANVAPEQQQNDNPFAAALRAAAENEAASNGNGRGRSANGERFNVRRIAPEDVPPGMRVVRTPFGDRLVEQ